MHTEEIERPMDVATKPSAPPINQDLITLDPQRYVMEVYAPYRGKLAKLIEESRAVVIDCSTTAGLAIATKWRAMFRDEVRVAVEATRVERKAPILMIGRLIDSESDAIKEEAKKHEDRFDAAIKAEAARKEAIKAAEKVRTDAIKGRIQAIRDLPMLAVGRDSTGIKALLGELQKQDVDETFAELVDMANTAWDAADKALNTALETAMQREAAEVQRLADIAAADQRRAEEAAEVARQRAENERIAAENAAAAKKLAEQQAALELAARQQRELAEEKARAEQAERDRIATEQRAKHDAEMAEIAAQRQALADEQAAAANRRADALAAEQLAVQVLADHDDALAMNEQFDADALAATRAALEAAAVAPVAAPLAALADAYAEPELTSFEIARFVIEAVALEFKMTEPEAAERLAQVDFKAYSAQGEAV